MKKNLAKSKKLLNFATQNGKRPGNLRQRPNEDCVATN